jgi:hypothetical protein
MDHNCYMALRPYSPNQHKEAFRGEVQENSRLENSAMGRDQWSLHE